MDREEKSRRKWKLRRGKKNWLTMLLCSRLLTVYDKLGIFFWPQSDKLGTRNAAREARLKICSIRELVEKFVFLNLLHAAFLLSGGGGRREGRWSNLLFIHQWDQQQFENFLHNTCPPFAFNQLVIYSSFRPPPPLPFVSRFLSVGEKVERH